MYNDYIILYYIIFHIYLYDHDVENDRTLCTHKTQLGIPIQVYTFCLYPVVKLV